MTRIVKQVSIMGSSFHNGAGNWIARMAAGTGLRLEREPTNKYDANAIGVHIFQQCLGYVPRSLAVELAPKMDAGLQVSAWKSPLIGAVMILQWDEPDDDDPAT